MATENTGPQLATCPECGAPMTDHGGIRQCTANPAHIDVYDLAAIKGPVTLKCRPRSPEPPARPDGLTQGELAAVGWAGKHHDRWPVEARGVADAMRHQWPWLDDDDLTRIALFFGHQLEHAQSFGWRDLDVRGWEQVLKAAAVELANLDLGRPSAERPTPTGRTAGRGPRGWLRSAFRLAVRALRRSRPAPARPAGGLGRGKP